MINELLKNIDVTIWIHKKWFSNVVPGIGLEEDEKA